MTAAPTLHLTGVSKSYGPVRALQDVSLEVRPGEVLGLIGENGAGKSTLIGVVAGTVRPDAGVVRVHGRDAPLGDARAMSASGVSVVVQEQALVESLRVYENLYLGREVDLVGRAPGRGRRLRRLARTLLAELHLDEIDADAVVADLTYPQRQLVEIAKAFAIAGGSDAPPIILLDEPTSALTEHEAEILFDLIARWRDRVAFIYVSHILQDVLRLSTRLLVLRDGRVVDTLANDEVTDQQLHALMVGRARSTDYYREEEQSGAQDDTPVAELRSASSAADFTQVDLVVRPGEIVGLAGVVGSGKSSVAAAIAGALPLSDGEVVIAGRTRRRWSVSHAVRQGVLYVPPERARDSLFPNASVRSNITIGFLDLLARRSVRLLRIRDERARATELSRRLAVKASSLSVPVRELSGGNQQKTVFARWIGRGHCQVLVLDDPTRGIDVGTREEIYGLIRSLAADGIGVVLCTESLEEVIGLADRVVVMRDGRVSAEIDAPGSTKPTEIDIVEHMM
ncbi:sugar ABC transporter ATP-binding protein [Nocardioides sp. YIM 152315]|uniref:sugar ABC transporter ATP-binding protein n=1 Tax=Nocardioides sp. YIM 152315 TaxID=3031760 RepID=UPI0023DB1513|nr:sugar ABC transporter ATP-binding protein [Nocardioides sp. YIM 152315]MDF1603738.1 sugar ABC transporter ATP-binding protein [Nocardioides sp. YIM 152315]